MNHRTHETTELSRRRSFKFLLNNDKSETYQQTGHSIFFVHTRSVLASTKRRNGISNTEQYQLICSHGLQKHTAKDNVLLASRITDKSKGGGGPLRLFKKPYFLLPNHANGYTKKSFSHKVSTQYAHYLSKQQWEVH